VLITGVIPQLRTTDLDASVRFYTEKVGLAVEFRHADFYAGIRAGDHAFHLKLVDTPDPSVAYVRNGDHLHLYLVTTDVDAVAEALRAHGVPLYREPRDTAWGTRELVFFDDQGHTVYVGQRAATASNGLHGRDRESSPRRSTGARRLIGP
jgi:catechol 2,3-dioxygenase-like lactoylglutathione lyase family enzyme